MNQELDGYTQIIAKKGKNKGKTIYLGDLESYVKTEIKEDRFTEMKDDYCVVCPYCRDAYKFDKSYKDPYLKHKLYVLKNFQMGHCFRCGNIFINQNDNLRFDLTVPEPPVSFKDFQLVKLDGDIWNLDMFNGFDDFSEKGFDYLITKRHRHFRQLKSLLNIKFSNDNPVIPFYYHGELIFYQIKLAFGNSNIPYFTPPIKHKPLYIIERKENRKFVICEGTFDAIACLVLFPDRTPVAILGSSITDYQITMLRTYVPEDILIYMDETELSKKNAIKISQYINYAEIHIRPSDGTDPEEYLKYKLKQETE